MSAPIPTPPMAPVSPSVTPESPPVAAAEARAVAPARVSSTVIVAPMTTGSRPARFRIARTFQGKQGLVVLDQIRTIDRVRLVKRLGALRPATLAATRQTLQAMFAP